MTDKDAGAIISSPLPLNFSQRFQSGVDKGFSQCSSNAGNDASEHLRAGSSGGGSAGLPFGRLALLARRVGASAAILPEGALDLESLFRGDNLKAASILVHLVRTTKAQN